jgi:protein-S-isoprenylcysteine O-methyltransferase Ste14
MNIPNRAWNIAFLAGFITYIAIRGAFAKRAKGNEVTIGRFDALERMLLIIVGVGSLLLPVLYLFTSWLAFADYPLPLFALWCGALLMAPALWLFYRSHADLGKNWSVTLELRKGHEIIKQGVYRSTRHPMYASIFLWDLAQGLLLQNWLAGWGALATFAVMYFVRMPREERMMCEFFGENYRDYMRQTGRLCPSLRFKKRA